MASFSQIYQGSFNLKENARNFQNLNNKVFDKILYYTKKFLLNPLNANPEKWSNTLKQIVGKLQTICLSVFDHFMNLALKGLKMIFLKCF